MLFVDVAGRLLSKISRSKEIRVADLVILG